MLTEADLAPTAAGPERPPVSWSLALCALLATGYSWLSLLRHRLVETAGYDLGIFTQAVRAYADLRAPVTPLKGPGFNLLGDHFHPVVALWAPAYRLLPHVETVLVAQAAVVAASVFPIHRLAVERLGRVPGTAVATAYGLSWALQGLITFDVHEVAFAVPLLAFGCVALVRERWSAACWWTLPLLLVKEDQAATVVAVGLYLLLRRRWREGVALCAARRRGRPGGHGGGDPGCQPARRLPILGHPVGRDRCR